jgi:hypothetical protein
MITTARQTVVDTACDERVIVLAIRCDQYKINLLQPNWLNLGTPFLATNSNVNISDAISSLERFYRVSVLP